MILAPNVRKKYLAKITSILFSLLITGYSQLGYAATIDEYLYPTDSGLNKLIMPRHVTITLDIANEIAAYLRANKLSEIEINDSKFLNNAFQTLLEPLSENTTLAILDLCANNISALDAKAIADALRENKSLTRLYLDNNNIGSIGLWTICNGLEENKTLITLSLEANDIPDVSAATISALLRLNITLAELDISMNEIGNDGVHTITSALALYNTTLTALDIDIDEKNNASRQIIDLTLERNKLMSTNHNDIQTQGLHKNIIKLLRETGFQFSEEDLTALKQENIVTPSSNNPEEEHENEVFLLQFSQNHSGRLISDHKRSNGITPTIINPKRHHQSRENIIYQQINLSKQLLSTNQ